MLYIFLAISTSLIGKVIPYTFNQQCKNASDIFIGQVVSLTVLRSDTFGLSVFEKFEIQFVVKKTWKGTVADTITCIAHEKICSPNIFEKNVTYLVYALNNEIELGTGRSADIRYSYTKKEIRKLNLRYLFRRPKKPNAQEVQK